MSESDYEPVSCDYHDQLEAAAMHKQEVELEFEARGVRVQERGTITDVFTREGAEYVKVEKPSGSIELRLDQILSMREVGKLSAPPA